MTCCYKVKSKINLKLLLGNIRWGRQHGHTAKGAEGSGQSRAPAGGAAFPGPVRPQRDRGPGLNWVLPGAHEPRSLLPSQLVQELAHLSWGPWAIPVK